MFPATLAIVVNVLTYVIKQKLEYGVTSFSLRTDDLLYGFYAFLEKPILGWGYWNFSGYEQFSGTINNSNGFIFLLFQLGVVGFSFYIFLILVVSKRILKQYSLKGVILFVIYIFASMANEPIAYTNYIILFLCLGIYLLLNSKKAVI
jgi:O-antigen ligase